MEIDTLSCDICGIEVPYPDGMYLHEHSELEIGGVPLNIWTPHYKLPTAIEKGSFGGIAELSGCIPVDISQPFADSGKTPLVRLNHPLLELYLKDESKNPTGSFKDRGISCMVLDALSRGFRQIAIPSTGNAAISLGYYCKKADIEPIVFLPKSTSDEKIRLIRDRSTIIYDTDLIESYEHFIRFCRQNPRIYNGFPSNNLIYAQGIKTMAYEIFLGLDNASPDWVALPVGSGGNVIGLNMGFNDLVLMGLATKLPRFATVQISGADPISCGYKANSLEKVVVLDEIAESRADAIASDTCFNYLKIMRILQETNGTAISVSDREIDSVDMDGMSLEYSSLSVFAALERLTPLTKRGDSVVLIGTAGSKRGVA